MDKILLKVWMNEEQANLDEGDPYIHTFLNSHIHPYKNEEQTNPNGGTALRILGHKNSKVKEEGGETFSLEELTTQLDKILLSMNSVNDEQLKMFHDRDLLGMLPNTPHSIHTIEFCGLDIPECWIKHKKKPYSNMSRLLRPFTALFYKGLLSNDFIDFDNYFSWISIPFKPNPKSPMNFVVTNMKRIARTNLSNFKVFVYEFQIAQFIHHHFNSEWVTLTQSNNLSVLFKTNRDYQLNFVDQGCIPKIPLKVWMYPRFNIEIQGPKRFEHIHSIESCIITNTLHLGVQRRKPMCLHLRSNSFS